MKLIRLVDGRVAFNMWFSGVEPDRLSCWHQPHGLGCPDGAVLAVVVAVGQFRHGLDVVPRGHPGDGRAELHEYRIARAQRAPMRRRLATGTHLPHPGIRTSSVRRVELRSPRPFQVEIDGEPAGRVTELLAEVVPAAYRLVL